MKPSWKEVLKPIRELQTMEDLHIFLNVEIFVTNNGNCYHPRHSAGSLVAVNSYFQDPQSVAALILVAPAIVAPLGGRLPRDNLVQEKNVSDSNVVGNPVIQLFNILSAAAKFIVQSIMQMMKRIFEAVDFLYIKVLSAFLRSTLILTLVKCFLSLFAKDSSCSIPFLY